MAGTDTLRDDLWTAVYNFLQTGTYAISTNNIYSSFNDKLISDIGFPLIIIPKPKIMREIIGMGPMPDEIISGVCEIIIYNNQAETVKTLTDEVSKKFTDGGRTGMANSWRFKMFEEDEEDADDEVNVKYHFYKLIIIFKKD